MDALGKISTFLKFSDFAKLKESKLSILFQASFPTLTCLGSLVLTDRMKNSRAFKVLALSSFLSYFLFRSLVNTASSFSSNKFDQLNDNLSQTQKELKAAKEANKKLEREKRQVEDQLKKEMTLEALNTLLFQRKSEFGRTNEAIVGQMQANSNKEDSQITYIPTDRAIPFIVRFLEIKALSDYEKSASGDDCITLQRIQAFRKQLEGPKIVTITKDGPRYNLNAWIKDEFRSLEEIDFNVTGFPLTSIDTLVKDKDLYFACQAAHEYNLFPLISHFSDRIAPIHQEMIDSLNNKFSDIDEDMPSFDIGDVSLEIFECIGRKLNHPLLLLRFIEDNSLSAKDQGLKLVQRLWKNLCAVTYTPERLKELLDSYKEGDLDWKKVYFYSYSLDLSQDISKIDKYLLEEVGSLVQEILIEKVAYLDQINDMVRLESISSYITNVHTCRLDCNLSENGWRQLGKLNCLNWLKINFSIETLAPPKLLESLKHVNKITTLDFQKFCNISPAFSTPLGNIMKNLQRLSVPFSKVEAVSLNCLFQNGEAFSQLTELALTRVVWNDSCLQQIGSYCSLFPKTLKKIHVCYALRKHDYYTSQIIKNKHTESLAKREITVYGHKNSKNNLFTI